MNVDNYFPDGSVVKNPPAMQETQEIRFDTWGWEDPLEEEITHSSGLEKMPWQEEEPVGLQGYCPWGHEESDTTEQLSTQAQTII